MGSGPRPPTVKGPRPICFRCQDGEAFDVEITAYPHLPQRTALVKGMTSKWGNRTFSARG